MSYRAETKTFFVRVVMVISAMMFLPCLVYSESVGGMTRRIQRSAATLPDGLSDAEDWEKSKKLSHFRTLPDSPVARRFHTEPEDLKEGAWVYLERCRVKVISVADKKNLLIRVEKDFLFWLKDYPTKGLVDGDRVHLLGPVVMDGTKTYRNALGGTNTVSVIRLFSQQDLKTVEEGEKAPYRHWKNKTDTGEPLEVCKFIKYEKGKVSLQRKNGNALDVQMFLLSKEDQKYIRSLLRKQRKKITEVRSLLDHFRKRLAADVAKEPAK